jgi:hypothetical protein
MLFKEIPNCISGVITDISIELVAELIEHQPTKPALKTL